MFTQVVIAISPYTSYTYGPTSLAFTESEAEQLCILGVYLKNYALAGMLLCFWSPRMTMQMLVA